MRAEVDCVTFAQGSSYSDARAILLLIVSYSVKCMGLRVSACWPSSDQAGDEV